MEIQCQGSAQEVYTKFKTNFQNQFAQGRLKMISDIQFNDGARTASAKGTGFEAQMRCMDGKIEVELKLGLLLKAMRSTIEEQVKHRISSALA